MKHWQTTVSRLALITGSLLSMAAACGSSNEHPLAVWGVVPGRVDVESRYEEKWTGGHKDDVVAYRMRDPELGGFYPAERTLVNGKESYVFTNAGNQMREQERLAQLKRRQGSTITATASGGGGGDGGGGGGGGGGGQGDG